MTVEVRGHRSAPRYIRVSKLWVGRVFGLNEYWLRWDTEEDLPQWNSVKAARSHHSHEDGCCKKKKKWIWLRWFQCRHECETTWRRERHPIRVEAKHADAPSRLRRSCRNTPNDEVPTQKGQRRNFHRAAGGRTLVICSDLYLRPRTSMTRL